MNNQSKKLDVVITKINKVNCKGTFGTKAKKDTIKYYTENASKLDSISLEQIEKYNFDTEIINLAYNLSKIAIVDKKIYKMIVGIEAHRYAPELNKIVLKNNTEIKAPQVYNIETALSFLVQNFSLEQLKAIK